jgi:hypothetical protein
MIPLQYRKPLLVAATVITVYALLGFFLAPWLVKNMATNAVRDNLGVELALQKVSVNPFVLSLRIDGLELEEPGGDPFLDVDRIFINFQMRSLFSWQLSFSEFDDAEPGSGPPRLLIRDFAITDSVVDWKDDVPPEPVDTQFGPVNIAISELNTLPDRTGLQDVVITTESQGTLSWNGSLELNPPRSEGHAAISGSHFPLASAYLKHEIGFDVDEGSVDVELDYRIDTHQDGTLTASISNLEMSVSDLQVRTFNEALGRSGPDREVLRLPAVRLWGGDFRWPEKTVTAAGFSIDDGVISLLLDAGGALNVLPAEGAELTAEGGQPETDPAPPTSDPWQLSLSQFSINRLALDVEDQRLEPPARLGWRSLDIDVRDVSNEPGALFPTAARLEALNGGSISIDGQLAVLPQPSFDLDLVVDALAFGMVDPYVKQIHEGGEPDLLGNRELAGDIGASVHGALRRHPYRAGRQRQSRPGAQGRRHRSRGRIERRETG